MENTKLYHKDIVNQLKNIEIKYTKLSKKINNLYHNKNLYTPKKIINSKKKIRDKLIKLIISFIIIFLCIYFILNNKTDIFNTVWQKLIVQGNTELNGNTICQKSLNVKDDTELEGYVFCKKSVNIEGNTDIYGNTILQKNVDINGNTNIEGNTNCKKSLNVSGNFNSETINCEGSLFVNNNMNLGGNASLNGDLTGKDITVSGTVSAKTLIQSSDKRLKKNFDILQDTYSKILNLEPLSYNLINDENKRLKYGFIAQEVEKIFPELIYYSDTEDIKNQLSIDYISFIPLIIEVLKIQNEIINNMNKL